MLSDPRFRRRQVLRPNWNLPSHRFLLKEDKRDIFYDK
jgi:hypothetical protein